MIVDRAIGLAALIIQYKQLQANAYEAEQFQSRANQFGALAGNIARSRAGLKRLSDAGIPVSFTPADGQGYAAKAKSLRVAIQADPATINDPPFDIKYEFVDRVNAIATSADKAAMEGWKNYVAQCANFGSNDVLSALAEVPQFRSSVAKIRQFRADIATLGNSLPDDPMSALTQLNNLVASHDLVWSELAADDIPKNVVAFIRSAANEGALLSAYSEEVRDWLRSRNLLAAFRVRLR